MPILKYLIEFYASDTQIIKAYHGSKKKFSSFSLDQTGSNIGTNIFDFFGIYFSPDKNFAIGFATQETISYHHNFKTGKYDEFISPESDGYVYTCSLFPKHILDIKSTREYNKYKKNEDLLKNYDLIIRSNIPYVNPQTLKKSLGIEYIVLDPSIITIEKIEHYSADGRLIK